MPPAQFDGLWQCLCPSFRSGVSLRRIHTTHRSLIRQSLIEPRRDPQCDQRFRNGHSQFVQHSPPKPASASRAIHSGEERSKKSPSEKEGLSAEAAYERLRDASKQANFQLVHRLVKLLVNRHGEKPNHRLYHALILANADPEYGSPGAVSTLLLEMREMDMTPDAAIYHAALKVCPTFNM